MFVRILKWLLPVLVLIGAIFIANIIKHARPKIPAAERVETHPRVRVVETQLTQFQPVVRTQGTVRPKQAIELVPEVAGKIIWVSPSFTNGGQFKKGETLVRIDPSNYQFAIERARAKVADAKAKLAKEIAEGDIARQDWEDLSQGEPATDLALRKPQLEGAKAALASAKADLHKAELDLKRTNIRAPFNGRVDVKRADIGKYVNLGTNLADIYSTDVAAIYLPLTDSQLAKIDLSPTYSHADGQKGLAVKLSTVVGGKKRFWDGKIVRTSGSVDQNSRVLNVIVEVKNPYSPRVDGVPLLNGMFVTADIPGVVYEDVTVLPPSAIRNQNKIVRVGTDNKMDILDIEIVDSGPDYVVVKGVPEASRVIVSPLDVVINGMVVEPDNAGPGNMSETP